MELKSCFLFWKIKLRTLWVSDLILNFVSLTWVCPLWDRADKKGQQVDELWAKQNRCFNHLPPHSQFVIHSISRQILTRQGLPSPGAQHKSDGYHIQGSGCLSSTRVSFMSCSSITWPGDCQSKVDYWAPHCSPAAGIYRPFFLVTDR